MQHAQEKTKAIEDSSFEDRQVGRDELAAYLGVQSRTLAKMIREGKLPERDLAITTRVGGWRLSTLRSHGFLVPLKAPAEKPAQG